jgi:histone-lysine N-methyltransferase, H3 lysine-4 specific
VGPPPPREIVICHLSPLTTPAPVLQQCRAFGAIDASELKVDPQTGESIGIMWVCFGGPRLDDASEAASNARRALDGQRIGPAFVQVFLDHDRKVYVQQYRALLKERYARKHQARAREREHEQKRLREELRERERQIRSNMRKRPNSYEPHSHSKNEPMSAVIAHRLSNLGHPYIFIPRMFSNSTDAESIRAYFSSFAPVLVERDHLGWYVGFQDHDAAFRCKMVLGSGTLHGCRLRLEIREPEDKGSNAEPSLTISPALPLSSEKIDSTSTKTTWSTDELVSEATSRILADFTSIILRDIKTRTVTPLIAHFLRSDGKGGAIIANHKSHSLSRSTSLGSVIPSFRRLDSIPKRAPVNQKGTVQNSLSLTLDSHAFLDPVGIGLAQDDEEMYLLDLLLRGQHAQECPPITTPDVPDLHEPGSARAQGFYRIPAADKAAHLADRNRAVVEASSATRSLASARNNRADSRRLALDIEQNRRETLADTDILHVNQLQTRKKQLRFAKSPIHDWGLFAMEPISAGDMVIEYVGEVVRQQVADHREKMYERSVRVCVSNMTGQLQYLSISCRR